MGSLKPGAVAENLVWAQLESYGQLDAAKRATLDAALDAVPFAFLELSDTLCAAPSSVMTTLGMLTGVSPAKLRPDPRPQTQGRPERDWRRRPPRPAWAARRPRLERRRRQRHLRRPEVPAAVPRHLGWRHRRHGQTARLQLLGSPLRRPAPAQRAALPRPRRAARHLPPP